VRELLGRAGVTLLHNAAETLRVRGRAVTLVGLGDMWAGELQPALAFDGPDANGGLRIVLAHNPDAKEALREYAWDVLLSGHTHGGQVKLPFVGPLLLPIRDRRFAEGLHRWEGRWVYVTRGVGNLHGIRFNCPPEVALLTVG
jgi:predicted MPP superfamily phosphohydrolase